MVTQVRCKFLFEHLRRRFKLGWTNREELLAGVAGASKYGGKQSAGRGI